MAIMRVIRRGRAFGQRPRACAWGSAGTGVLAAALTASLMPGCKDARSTSVDGAPSTAPPARAAPQPSPSAGPVPEPVAAPTSPPASAPETPKPDATVTEYTGVLRGGLMAIGAETTGWALADSPQFPGEAVELEAFTLIPRLEALEGKRVTVTGRLVTRDLVERGPTRRLVVTSIRAAE